MRGHSAATALFVPGDRPDRFEKAMASGAALVIIDLEDAVAAEAKAAARDHAVTWLGRLPARRRLAIRINRAGTTEGIADVVAVRAASALLAGLGAIVVPKCESGDIVSRLAAQLGGIAPLIPIIESAQGVVSANEIAQADTVVRLAFGSADFELDAGVARSSDVVRVARSQVVLASAAASLVAPYDSPSFDIRDLDRVAADARNARDEGFGGKLCIHPRQVAVVRSAFVPTSEELAWARSIVGGGGGARQVDGQMIDGPIAERARRMLAVVDE